MFLLGVRGVGHWTCVAGLHGGVQVIMGLPLEVWTVTSFQKRFFIALPGFMCVARRSCPRLRSSAWRRRRSMRSPCWDAAGRGAEGGGPGVVMGRGSAGLGAVLWRYWWSLGGIVGDGMVRWDVEKSEDEGTRVRLFMFEDSNVDDWG